MASIDALLTRRQLLLHASYLSSYNKDKLCPPFGSTIQNHPWTVMIHSNQ
jgi:hypothetical protein